MAEKTVKKKIVKHEKRKSCPKCGEGFRLAEHKDRRYCGKCHYTEAKDAPKKA